MEIDIACRRFSIKVRGSIADLHSHNNLLLKIPFLYERVFILKFSKCFW